jgi:predicted Holliday junction resolvase-like endonuclease
MNGNGLLADLTRFFKAARHLWGRCPRCGDLFRLSEAAISFGEEPPKDWLRRLQHTQDQLAAKQRELDVWQAGLDSQELDLADRERDVMDRERNLERTAREMAKGMVKDDKTVKALLTEARRQAVQRSRSTLLGHLFERLAPFFHNFDHDPRDVRPLMNPIDYVVFDGLTVNREVDRIVFVEVKCGTSRESSAQRSIREAIRHNRVTLETWQVGKRGIPLEQQLLGSGRPTVREPQPSAAAPKADVASA